MNRRDFLKHLGLGAAATAALLIPGTDAWTEAMEPRRRWWQGWGKPQEPVWHTSVFGNSGFRNTCANADLLVMVQDPTGGRHIYTLTPGQWVRLPHAGQIIDAEIRVPYQSANARFTIHSTVEY